MTDSLERLLSIEHASTDTRVAVVGAGYVGLTVAAGLAHLGHTVVCVDSASWKVSKLRAGSVPIVEEGLAELVARMQRFGRLDFSTDTVAAAAGADFVFLCVPTPQGAGGEADLHHVLDVADLIGPVLRPGAIVINKSTVPVGTADLVSMRLKRADTSVVSHPEFLAEGSALRNFLEPDRIVIGSRHADAAVSVAGLYASVRSEVIITDIRSAEMIKYASNAFLAAKLSFVNSIAELCEAAGADIRAVTRGMGSDRRIGSAFLSPGPGWGGSCFPKDTRALLRTSADYDIDLPVVRAAIGVNEHVLTSIVRRVVAAIPADLRDPIAAVWGLTYKAGTDDLRDSPALGIIDGLRAAGVAVQVYDPTRVEPLAGMTICLDTYAACRGATVLVIATEWPEFAEADFHRVLAAMTGRVVIDTRNVLNAAAVRTSGLTYTGMGIGDTAAVGARTSRRRPLAAVPR